MVISTRGMVRGVDYEVHELNIGEVMNERKLIFRQAWDFDLYRVGDDYILTVVFSEYNN